MNIDVSAVSDLDMWSALVGFGLPALIAVLVQSHWSAQIKGVITAAVCVLGGFVTAALTGDLHGTTIVRSVLVVLGSAVTFYRVFWKPTKIASAIEEATNVTPPSVE